MAHRIATLTGLLLLTTALSACMQQQPAPKAQSAADMAPGTYEKTTTRTDADGTTVKHKDSTVVQEDAYGNKKAVVKSKTTQDPKGLFNKTTTSQSKEVVKERY